MTGSIPQLDRSKSISLRVWPGLVSLVLPASPPAGAKNKEKYFFLILPVRKSLELYLSIRKYIHILLLLGECKVINQIGLKVHYKMYILLLMYRPNLGFRFKKKNNLVDKLIIKSYQYTNKNILMKPIKSQNSFNYFFIKK